MSEQIPPGQGPISPQGAFTPPPPPPGAPMPPGYPPPFMSAPSHVPPPPMMPMPMPTAPAGRSFTRAVFTTLATTIFSLSLLLNLWLLATSGLFKSTGGTETVIRDGKSDQKIVVVPIHGLIDNDMAIQVNEWFKRIEKDATVKAVVLSVDTPGGGVTASDQIHHLIKQLQARKSMKVCVTMGSMATSGGYYVSCAADQIFAQETTLTGNIGVIFPRYNMSEMIRKWGIEEKTITAPPDGLKNAGSMFAPEDPKDRAYFQGIIDQAYGRFTSLVDAGRKGRLKPETPRKELYSGAIFTARQALNHGLIDAIGYADDAYQWAAQQASLSEPMVVKYQKRPSIMDLLGGSANIGAPGARGNVNVQVNIDPRTIDELTSPRLMYLWRGE